MSKANIKGTVTSVEPLDTKDAKWVRLVKISYDDPNSTPRTWESSERLTRPKDSESDGVGIIAVLKAPGQKPAILLQKQYRPPIDKICIEVPAGLIDAGETPEECAIRELKEETGYVGTLAKGDDSGSVSCLMFNDPGFCNTNLNFVHITIDMTLEENKNPVQNLEENEFIECFTVPLDELWETCRKLADEGCGIDARVGTLAEGFRVAKMWGMFK
ncbi:hypothetical protein H072_7654 [Dactylellina haptotyla CBS 200.50]|uniref:Nudix hydrolase domain-containing protein n=1 Tax=Dactylellina haptotyla (strain CBS 200.50) TaxID=1284197 RepID=S8BTK3_DACHA|nr:hypothetical protein H072_7654 [Dactylellina haptotyla CBS 200.50]